VNAVIDSPSVSPSHGPTMIGFPLLNDDNAETGTSTAVFIPVLDNDNYIPISKHFNENQIPFLLFFISSISVNFILLHP